LSSISLSLSLNPSILFLSLHSLSLSLSHTHTHTERERERERERESSQALQTIHHESALSVINSSDAFWEILWDRRQPPLAYESLSNSLSSPTPSWHPLCISTSGLLPTKRKTKHDGGAEGAWGYTALGWVGPQYVHTETWISLFLRLLCNICIYSVHFKETFHTRTRTSPGYWRAPL
jgi:hypothetical protein